VHKKNYHWTMESWNMNSNAVAHNRKFKLYPEISANFQVEAEKLVWYP